MSKRSNGEATYRQRKNGLWEGRIVVGYKADGSPNRLSRYGKTKKEVIKKINKLKSEVESGKKIDSDKMLFSNWNDEVYRLFKKDTISISTQELYEQIFDTHFKKSIIDVPLKDLTTQQIQAFLNQKGLTLSRESVKRMKTLINWSLNKAIEQRVLLFNPCKGTIIPKCNTENEREVLPLSDSDLKLLHNYIKQSDKQQELRIITITTLLLKTGMRIGECLALGKSDVNLKNQTITITKSLTNTKQGLIIGAPKTKNSYRVIPLPVSVIPLLKRWEIQRNKKRLLWGEIWEHDDLYFCTDTGKFIDARNTRRSFRRLLTRAGVEDSDKYCLHSLRHTAATKMWELHIDSAVASQILGHDITTMLKVYVAVQDEFKKKAIALLDEAI